ncbi:MAG: thioredoxin family protein [bacterium]|nr:thioredoxin family protein [bacterium]
MVFLEQQFIQRFWLMTAGVGLLIAACDSHRSGHQSAITASGGADSCFHSAEGEEVCIGDYEGSYLWVDYGAPWCSTCKKQLPVMKQVDNRAGDELAFATVMTSGMKGYGSVASVADTKQWGQRRGLGPEDVLIADNLSAETVPFHELYSPEGRKIYSHSGFLSAGEIQQVIKRMVD